MKPEKISKTSPTLWYFNIAIENGHSNSEFSHWKRWIFPVRYVTNYHRVDDLHPWIPGCPRHQVQLPISTSCPKLLPSRHAQLFPCRDRDDGIQRRGGRQQGATAVEVAQGEEQVVVSTWCQMRHHWEKKSEETGMKPWYFFLKLW